MKKKLIYILLVAFFLTVLAFAAVKFRQNERRIDDGNKYLNDLETKKV